MDIKEFERKALEATNLLKAMSNENRLLILCQLIHGEKTVGELEEVIGLSQSALSQHLAVLRQNGLVQTRRDAQSIYYSLAGEEPEAVIEALYDLFAEKAGDAKNGGTGPH
ncbi:MAG: winged helix-turn-helix transcriptional regulator [Rhodobacterales bacterium]|nr:winged helix-turn-helix transcriptional regulator [Rhodobacterales bacterium]